MALGYLPQKMAATRLSGDDSDGEMHDDQEPSFHRSKSVNSESDRDKPRPEKSTHQIINDGDPLLHSRKRAGSPLLSPPDHRRTFIETDPDRSTPEPPPAYTRMDTAVADVLNDKAKWKALAFVPRTESKAEEDGILNQEELASIVPENDSQGERLRGSRNGLRNPLLLRYLQQSYRAYAANGATVPMADQSLDRLLPLVIAANDALGHYNSRSPITSESSKAPSPLAALDSESTGNGRHNIARTAGPRPSNVNAVLNTTEKGMDIDHSCDQPISHSAKDLHETVNGSINQTSILDTEPHISTTEHANQAPKVLKPQLKSQPIGPMLMPRSPKAIHRWATFNGLKPYELAMRIQDGNVSELHDPAKAIEETPYNDGYRYWTLPEYQILIDRKKEGKSWENVAEKLPGRDADECRNRWERRDRMGVPDPDGRHPHWHKEEEDILRDGRSAGYSFARIAESLPARSTAGCRTRWKEKFEPPQKPEQPPWFEKEAENRPWTQREDEQLKKLRKHDMSWTQIAMEHPARSKKMYKEHWKDLEYRKRRPQPASEDSDARAARHQLPSPTSLPGRASDAHDYVDGKTSSHSLRSTEGPNRISVRYAQYLPADGSLSAQSVDSYFFPQSSRSTNAVGDHAQGSFQPDGRSVPGGYNTPTHRGTDLPQSRVTLPPISTMQYPYSAPPYPRGRHPDHTKCLPDDSRSAMENALMHRGPRSAVEPGVSQARVSIQQQPLARQNEQYHYLYRWEGNVWQETEVADPVQQLVPRPQEPRALNCSRAQAPAPGTYTTASHHQATYPQPQNNSTSVKDCPVPQASTRPVAYAEQLHEGRVIQPADPNLNPNGSEYLHNVGGAERWNTNLSAPQTRTTTISKYYPTNSKSSSLNDNQPIFGPFRPTNIASIQHQRTSDSSPHIRQQPSRPTTSAPLSDHPDSPRLFHRPMNSSNTYGTEFPNHAGSTGGWGPNPSTPQTRTMMTRELDPANPRSQNSNGNMPTFRTSGLVTQVSRRGTESSPHELHDLRDLTTSALPHEHDGGPRPLYHDSDSKSQCG